MNSTRSGSLPPLSPGLGERGRGLAELKGVDPMDRRIEVEKKEQYARALREQMAHGDGSLRSRPSSNCGIPPPAPSSSAGGEPPAAGAAPHSSSQRSPQRCQTPLTASYEPAWGTADKVSQVQDFLRQKVRVLEEDQQQMWARMQAFLADHEGSARQAAEQEALQRQLEQLQREQEAVGARHGEGLRAAAGEAEALRREFASRAQREAALEQELASLRQDLRAAAGEAEGLRRDFAGQAQRAGASQQDLGWLRQEVERLSAESSQHHSQLQVHQAEIDRLKHAHEECARFRAELREQLERQRAELEQRLVSQLRELESRLGSQLDAQLREAREADARANGQAVEELRRQLQDLAGRVGDAPALISQLRDEMSRLAAKAAREALERMPRPQPQEPPPVAPSPPPAPQVENVSEEAFAILRGDGEQYELPETRNVVGRSASCNVCIPTSQAISNRHASVDFGGDSKVTIRDLGSRNGTFLNDHRVDQGNGFLLSSGDAVRLGCDGPTYVFEYGPAFYARWPRELERAREGRGVGRR